MSVYNTLKVFLKEHEDFIKSEGFSIKSILKYVKGKFIDPATALRRLEEKYAKYVKRQHDLFGPRNFALFWICHWIKETNK